MALTTWSPKVHIRNIVQETSVKRAMSRHYRAEYSGGGLQILTSSLLTQSTPALDFLAPWRAVACSSSSMQKHINHLCPPPSFPPTVCQSPDHSYSSYLMLPNVRFLCIPTATMLFHKLIVSHWMRKWMTHSLPLFLPSSEPSPIIVNNNITITNKTKN